VQPTGRLADRLFGFIMYVAQPGVNASCALLRKA
jgi:hypothetical protein